MAQIDGIFIATVAGGAMTRIQRATLVPERGIDGDRYFAGQGSFSRWPGSGREITLIEREVLVAIQTETGLDLHAGQSRRNFVTSGIRLTTLNGKWFRIGAVLLHGARECAPCKYLERLVPGSFAALKGRGGLRAEIHSRGVIVPGDEIIEGRL